MTNEELFDEVNMDKITAINLIEDEPYTKTIDDAMYFLEIKCGQIIDYMKMNAHTFEKLRICACTTFMPEEEPHKILSSGFYGSYIGCKININNDLPDGEVVFVTRDKENNYGSKD